MDLVLSLNDVLRAIDKGKIRFTDHAVAQMNRRLFFKADVIQIAQTCTRFEWQADKKTYLVTGYAENEKGAAFSCVYQEGVVVVTVMWRHLSRKERRAR